MGDVQEFSAAAVEELRERAERAQEAAIEARRDRQTALDKLRWAEARVAELEAALQRVEGELEAAVDHVRVLANAEADRDAAETEVARLDELAASRHEQLVIALQLGEWCAAEREAALDALRELVCGDPTCERCALGYRVLGIEQTDD